jgi:CDGSH-type Zn-finger protein/uncharacterized Fe-S cluster protein YjdI
VKPIEIDDLIIRFDGKRCIHARRCVLGLPGVFDPEARPWINPGDTDSGRITDVIEACPSGALSYERKSGAAEELPETNTARLWENGPIEFHGDLRIPGHDPVPRAVICRCGRTGNPPFCDNSHRNGFVATGIPPADEKRDRPAEAPGGPVEITALANGSVKVEGALEILAQDGQRVARTQKTFLCRCGNSGAKPFCDGTHNKLGFTKATGAEPVED